MSSDRLGSMMYMGLVRDGSVEEVRFARNRERIVIFTSLATYIEL
jgi:hypothetical protein